MGKKPITKMPLNQRAKIFLPFDSLRGYYDLVREQERVKMDKKLLSMEEKEKISNKLSKLCKRDIVSIKYYDVDAYTIIEGMISEIDLIYKTITIVKTKIKFDDILDIKGDKIYECEF